VRNAGISSIKQISVSNWRYLPTASARVTTLTNYLVTKGFSGPDAASAAHGYLYQQLQHQVSLLSFLDCFRVISWLTLAVVPVVLLVPAFQAGRKSPAAH